MTKKILIFVCFILAGLIGAAAEPTWSLKAGKTFSSITTTRESGGARPEIFYFNGKLNIIYRDSLTLMSQGQAASGLKDPKASPRGNFRLKAFDADFNPQGSSRVLIPSGQNYGVTDIRVTTDGKFVYAAYETASRDGRSLILEKFDTLFVRVAKTQVAASSKPGKGVEALDDPAIVVADKSVFVMTKIGFGRGQQFYRVREFSLDLKLLRPSFDISIPMDVGIGGVNSVVFKDGHFYLFTTVHISGRPVCPQADETTNNDLYVFEYDRSWEFTGVSQVLANEPGIEYYPTGAKFVNDKFYIVYLKNDIHTILPTCGGGTGNLGIGEIRLLILDQDFNPIAAKTLTDNGEIANHPTLEVMGDKIFVAYGHKEGQGLGLGSSNVWTRILKLVQE